MTSCIKALLVYNGNREYHNVFYPLPHVWYVPIEPDVPEFIDWVGDKIYPIPRKEKEFKLVRFSDGSFQYEETKQ
jgi:hypothetical protein